MHFPGVKGGPLQVGAAASPQCPSVCFGQRPACHLGPGSRRPSRAPRPHAPLAKRSIFAGAAHSLVIQVRVRSAGRERGLPRASGHVRGMFWGSAPTRDMETGATSSGRPDKKHRHRPEPQDYCSLGGRSPVTPPPRAAQPSSC